MEFIAHTAPDDNIPSKNQEIQIGVPNNILTGENTSKDKTKPPQVLKHIGHDNIPSMNLGKNAIEEFESPAFLKKSLSPWNILP